MLEPVSIAFAVSFEEGGDDEEEEEEEEEGGIPRSCSNFAFAFASSFAFFFAAFASCFFRRRYSRSRRSSLSCSGVFLIHSLVLAFHWCL